MDINKPVENPELVKAIAELQKNNTDETADKMVQEVLKSNFLSPVTVTGLSKNASGPIVLKKGMTISFPLLTNTNNEKFYPVFTDWDSLREWKNEKDQQTFITTFNDMASMVLNNDADGFAIDPATQNTERVSSCIS